MFFDILVTQLHIGVWLQLISDLGTSTTEWTYMDGNMQGAPLKGSKNNQLDSKKYNRNGHVFHLNVLVPLTYKFYFFFKESKHVLKHHGKVL